jgi:transposase InsO family protein
MRSRKTGQTETKLFESFAGARRKLTGFDSYNRVQPHLFLENQTPAQVRRVFLRD